MKTVLPLLLLSLLAACARPQAAPDTASATTPDAAAARPADTGSDNPAAAFCVQQGGLSEIFTDRAGNEYGMCRLKDGRIMEEWEYLRQYGKKIPRGKSAAKP